MEPTLRAQVRTIFGKQNRKLRLQGMLPAILYGKGKPTQSLEVKQKEFEKVFRQSGENTLINLQIEGGGERKVLIHDVAKHYLKNEPIHVDFYEVDLTRKIHAKIPLHFVGTAAAVKESGGVLVRNMAELSIEALPTDLPPFIEVNIESLKQFNDLVRVGDLRLPETIRVLSHPEEVLVTVQAPRTEEELAELEKPTAEAEKAVIESMAAETAKPEGGAEEGAKAEEGKPETPEPKPKETAKTKEK